MFYGMMLLISSQKAGPLMKPVRRKRSSLTHLSNPTHTTDRSWLAPAGRLYRQISGRLLDTIVKPNTFGDLPHLSAPSQGDLAHEGSSDQRLATVSRPVCYVMLQAAGPDALLVEGEARRHQLPRPLEQMDSYLLNERAALISLLPGHDRDSSRQHPDDPPPRLVRLIQALQQNPTLDIDIVPVTVLWGRAPDREVPWWRLLLADAFAPPTILRQSLNIALHRQDTFIQFHPTMSLRDMLAEQDTTPEQAVRPIYQSLIDYLQGQREVVLGPDLSDRRNLVTDLLDGPEMQQAIQQASASQNIPPEQARQRARQYLEEIVTNYTHTAILFFESSLARLWNQLYDGLEVFNFNEVRSLADTHEIVYVPCHRSHMDYLLLSFIIYTRGMTPPYVAAGNNLDIPGVGPLLRRAGAFFIRRSFRDNPLYGAALREYVHSILDRNHPIEYFVEGGRSRSGRLLPPKTGMLAMTMLSQLRPGTGKPVVFIPTYIGYERLMEGVTYVGEMQGKPKEAESLIGLLKSMRKIERIFGKVYINFGEPIYMEAIKHAYALQELPDQTDVLPPTAKQAVATLADQIMRNINRAAVINPVSLLALVLLSTPKHALDEGLCVHQLDLCRELAISAAYDSRTEVTTMAGHEIIAYGLKLKLIERVHHVMGDMIQIASHQAVLLTYFRNNVLHLFVIDSLISALIRRNGRIGQRDVKGIIAGLYPFLQAELFLKWEPEQLDEVIDTHLAALAKQGVIRMDDEMLCAPLPNSEAFGQLTVLATAVEQSLERYLMVIYLLTQQGSSQITASQLEDLCVMLGQRLSVLYEFQAPEFFERPLFRSFIETLLKQGLVWRHPEHERLQFDQRLTDLAANAPLILDVETRHTIEHLTSVGDAEMRQAMLALERKKTSRLKRKSS